MLILSVLLVLVGFVLLIYGANWLVSGASSLAKRFNISDLAIGLTIVAFGTSAPELVVNCIASFDDQADIVFGNVIGSNNFNLFIILGIVAVISPIAVQKSTIWKELPISILAAVVLLLMGYNFFMGEDMTVSRVDGIVLLILFVGFLYYVYKQMKLGKVEDLEEEIDQTMSTLKITLFILIGLAGLIFGGKLVVDNAIFVAESFGVSKKIIGLTVIAAGTSLPELVTSIVAARKGKSDIAIGNVVGSNIFNILFVLGTSAVINPLVYSSKFDLDIFILLGGSFFLFACMFMGKRNIIDRWQGLILLIGFVAYTGYLISLES